MKHLDTLRNAVLALAALTAMVGVAPASAAEFHAAPSTALDGVQVNSHVFTVTGQKVTCKTATFTGTASASGTAETQTLHPEYNNCTVVDLPANVNTAGCLFDFNANLTTVNLTSCTNGGITIDSSNAFSHCQLHIPNQNGINNQTFINMGETASGNATLTEESNANNVTVTVTVSNGLCPLTTGHHNTGEYTGLTGIMGATGGTHRN